MIRRSPLLALLFPLATLAVARAADAPGTVGAALAAEPVAASAAGTAPAEAAAVAAPEAPYALVEGYEGPPPRPVRDLDADVYAWTERTETVLARRAGGWALLDPAGDVQRELPCGDDGPPVDAAAGAGMVAALSGEGRLCAWDLKGTPALWPSARKGYTRVALGADALALGRADGRVEVRDARSGKLRWRRQLSRGAISGIAVDEHARRLVVGTAGRGLAVLDLQRGRLLRAFAHDEVTAIAVAPQGEKLDWGDPRVAAGRPDGRVELWDLRTWQLRGTWRAGEGRVADLDWSPDGEQLAAALVSGAGATLEVRDDRRDEPLLSASLGPAAGPVRFRYSPAADRMVASAGDGRSRVWRMPIPPRLPRPVSLEPPRHRDPRDPALVVPAAVPPATPLPPGVQALTAGRRVLVRDVDGLRVATVGAEPGPALEGGAEAEGPLVLAPDGARVFGWVRSGHVVLWDAATGAALGRLESPRPRALAMARGRVAVAREDGTVGVAGPGEARFRDLAGVAGATVVALDAAHPGRIAVGNAAGEVRLVDPRRRAPSTWVVHAGPVAALAFSPDGQRLASAGPRAGAPGALVALLDAEVREEGGENAAFVLDRVPARLQVGEGLVAAFDPLGAVVLDMDGGVRLDLPAPLADGALADDGRHALVADLAGALREVAVAPAPLPWLPRGRRVVRSLDGGRAALLDGDQVSLWDGLAGRRDLELPPGPAAAEDAAFDTAGARLAVRWADRTVDVFEVATGLPLRNLAGPPPGADPGLWFSPDGALLWAMAGPREAVATEVATGTARARIAVPGEGALRVDPATARSRFVALADAAGRRTWLDATGALGAFDEAAEGCPLATFDGRVALARGTEVALVDEERRKPRGPELRGVGARPACAGAFTPKGDRLAVAYDDGVLRVWELKGSRVVATLDAGAPPRWRSDPGVVAGLAFDADGRKLTAVDTEGRPRTWDVRLGYEDPAWPGRIGAVVRTGGAGALRLSPDGTRVYSAHDDATARAWDLATGAQVALYGGAAGPATSVAPSADGLRLAVGAADGSARVFDVERQTELVGFATWGAPVVAVAIDARGTRLAAVAEDGLVRAWDVERRKALGRWRVAEPGGPFPRGVAFAADGALEVVGATGVRHRVDLGTRVDTVGPAPFAPPTPVEDAALALAARFGPVVSTVRTPDGATLVAAGADGVLRLWDAPTGTLRAALVPLSDGSWVVDRADGVRVAGGSLRDVTAPRLFSPNATDGHRH